VRVDSALRWVFTNAELGIFMALYRGVEGGGRREVYGKAIQFGL
jgi:hypothetical protein